MKKFVAMMLALMMTLGMASAMADTIRIGVVGPFTGPAAVYGCAVRDAATIAAEEINAANPDGLQIELFAQDDQHDAEIAVNAYNALWDDEVQMILGTVTTTPCIAVGAKAYQDRMFMLTPSASATAVTEGKDNVYQVCFTDPNQGTASADYISEHNLGTAIGVIYNNADAYSTGIYQTFVARAAELGLNVVATSTFTDDTTDFSVQVAACQNAGADLVFLPIYYTPASMILVQANATGYTPVVFGVDGMDGILSIEGFDTSLAEGVMLLTPFAADAQDEATVKFVTTYRERFGDTPNQFAADAYDGIYALYNAAVSAGITGDTTAEDACELLIEQFKTLQIDGLTGSMTWNEDGTVSKTPTAVVIQNGVYVSAENAQ